ncbi:MAG: site-specific DNA-methyltransferase [Cytophagales bacterium]|nr:site-specific DNA-methyltransferase [Cytophagales bacterium]
MIQLGMASNIPNRSLFCHDNLEILQGINSSSIDLIYLDPPFNKKKTFTASMGSDAEGAIFRDIFREGDLKEGFLDAIKEDHPKMHSFLESQRNRKGKSYNFCYLTYMAIRLMEMDRILKSTGSIYLHCDPTMSHYLKILMDMIFGEENFRNEIIWCYAGGGISKRDFPKKHDVILRYGKSMDYTFNVDDVRVPYESDQREAQFSVRSRAPGFIYKPHPKGKVVEDWWRNLPRPYGGDHVGYPTQKPLKLLERIIKVSSHVGDLVLDPFCGCATTCVAAEKLGRQWIGIDVSVKTYELLKQRLAKEIERRDNAESGILFWEAKINYQTDRPPKRTDRREKT